MSQRPEPIEDPMGGVLRRTSQCARLVESLCPRLVRAARRQFGLGDEEARDLVQEVVADWLVYANSRDGALTYRDEGHLLMVLHRMSVQRWIDRRRRSETANSPVSDATAPLTVEDDLLARLFRQDVIQKEFHRLPARRREVLLACYLQDLTQDEVAARTGIDRRLISDWKRKFERAVERRARESEGYE